MADTITYRGRTYGESDALALMQALAGAGQAHSLGYYVTGIPGHQWHAHVKGEAGSSSTSAWLALVAAVRAAGLEDADAKEPADAAK